MGIQEGRQKKEGRKKGWEEGRKGGREKKNKYIRNEEKISGRKAELADSISES